MDEYDGDDFSIKNNLYDIDEEFNENERENEEEKSFNDKKN